MCEDTVLNLLVINFETAMTLECPSICYTWKRDDIGE
jgi:hypothetical protein